MDILKNISLLFLLGFLSVRLTIAADQPNGAGSLPLDTLRTFAEVFAKIKKDYVEPVSDEQLLDNAIKGMLQGLDPHSAFLDTISYQQLQESALGKFGGLGIEVDMEDGFIKVIAPIDDTPAQRAGIQPGDLIVRLNDIPVRGMNLNEAIKIMRGKPGTDIVLTIVRKSEEKPITVTITRAIITIESVRSKTLEPGFGYIRISNFQPRTVKDLREHIDKLKEDNENQIQGLILDLRNNPGGTLNAAVGVSDLFLDGGLIVYTEGRTPGSRLKFNATPLDLLDNVPLITLVNAGSASASEIVAGALKDNERAIIVGQQTFGKGSVQTVLPMMNNTVLKLTTARYYTPSDHSIQAAGITPDIIIENSIIELKKEQTSRHLKEANLSGHLKNQEDTGIKPKQRQEIAEVDVPDRPLVEVDFQLYQALNLLKALAIQYDYANRD